MSDSASTNKTLPMAAIGSYEMVLPFQAVGVKTVVLDAEKRGTFEDTLEKLAREGYAVVFIQEDLFERADQFHFQLHLSFLPSVSRSWFLRPR